MTRNSTPICNILSVMSYETQSVANEPSKNWSTCKHSLLCILSVYGSPPRMFALSPFFHFFSFENGREGGGRRGENLVMHVACISDFGSNKKRENWSTLFCAGAMS